MDPTFEQWRFKKGDQVVSADGHKLGKVVGCHPDGPRPTHMVVERGLLFHHDFRVPLRAVSNYEDGTVYLNVTKDAALTEGWEAAPMDSAAAGTGSEERLL